MLIVWEAIAAGYLLGGLALTWYRSVRGQQVPPRTGVLDALSWIFPLVASLVGVNAALLAITVRAPIDGTRAGYTFTGVVAALGIILSWHLLHTGFAQIYESMQHRNPQQPGLEFPRTTTPGLADYLYFAFTVGTSFATSDTSVTTVRMRWLVLLHSVVSFFYNALVVAVAIQIIQQIAGA
ncbi:DUF1345 domain-containing protein [Microbacterium oxydans]|uniref:DUF1345 domain-containing protein n=1 Tax=Microbacterium oxydans TaxID=82380 RepID=UPI0024AE020F|nr:DUF1345 domain-containing protein [Microbacterium oxydans]